MENEKLKIDKELFFGKDDEELIALINKHDEMALLQFSMKHIGHLIYWIDWHGHHFDQESLFMRLLLPDFLETVRVFAKRYQHRSLPEEWQTEFKQLNFKKYSVKLAKMIDDKHRSWVNFKATTDQLQFLNQLNSYLTKLEIKIIERVEEKVSKLENRFKDYNSLEIGLECEVDVSFYRKEVQKASYSISFYFNREPVHMNKWMFLCSKKDWYIGGWLPKLNDRCCYLMHKVIYHSNLMDEIFTIDRISLETKVLHQDFSTYSMTGWHNPK